MTFAHLLEISLHFDQRLGSLVVQYGGVAYAILFFIVFVEIGILPLFFLPGDPLIFICGALAGVGTLDAWIVVPVLFAATLMGSVVGYAIGRSVGETVNVVNYRWLSHQALCRAHAFYETRGGLTLLVSPFIAVVRTFAPFAAGMSRMAFPRFVSYASTGAALWVSSLAATGYLFGNVPFIHDHISTIALFGVGLGVGSLLIGGLRHLAAARLQRTRKKDPQLP
ncbi:VTT domain-containing protein [Burkholderia metallica]|uniref:VTT domain-containing protein n=1 Tax=Burkholderia metallica TaxID=488729 RepID=UPI001CF18A64|nr:VTT domain-containing protein [Burkholderia metallica]MCA8023621.1 VTT domain-containing protein [Burkholderia metallica]